VWRVGRGDNPLATSMIPADLLAENRAGNRFDSPKGDYGVTYYGSDLTCCFGETLARLRPKPELAVLVRDEWRERNFMEVGAVAAEWRQRRIAVRVKVKGTFLDVEALSTRARLRQELVTELARLGYDDFDVPTIRGSDRRPTRAVSQWAHEQTDRRGNRRYAGIRYMSRINSSWECWAVFEEVPVEIVESHAITLDMPELRKVEKLFDLCVH
jgi:hypothetical protein